MSNQVIRFTILKKVDNKVETIHVNSLTSDLLEKHKRDIILDNISGNAEFGAHYLKTLVEDKYKDYLRETALPDNELSKILFHYERNNPNRFSNHLPVNSLCLVNLIQHVHNALRQK